MSSDPVVFLRQLGSIPSYTPIPTPVGPSVNNWQREKPKA